jgi:predicted RNase H-like HicB family nuclease
MSSRTTYVVEAVRSGRWWAIRVPELPGVFSQARTLPEARAMVADAIALVLDVPSDSFDVDLHAFISASEDGRGRESVAAMVEAVAARKEAAERAASEAATAMRRAATRLADTGMTLRDAGELLGVSYQRIQQLVGDSGHANPRSGGRHAR